jgi:hypothetical protein
MGQWPRHHLSWAGTGPGGARPQRALSRALASRARRRTFYDLDTPVTRARLQADETVDYIRPRGLQDFDLVLSFTGGAALTALQTRFGLRAVTAVRCRLRRE